jgi:hypothetical protein
MKIPLKELLSAVPGMFGIRLEDEPAFTVEKADGAFEIRHYEKMILAQTHVAGDHDHAVDEGFRVLAGYIFGGNQTKTTMSMTTPVLQNQVLPMTAPVLQERSQTAGGAGWTISFVLPAEYLSKAPPRPLDSRVTFATISPKTVAVYRYTGNNSEEKMTDGKQKLMAWMKSVGAMAAGEMQCAQYDQPFAVPFLKRNEVQIEIRSPQH